MSAVPQLIAFDLDDTLAPSKSPIDDEIAQLIPRLLDSVPVCIISGGTFDQFQRQVIACLDLTPAQLDALHLMPTCGTKYLRFDDGAWVERYAVELTADERSRTIEAIEAAARALGLWTDHGWGPLIEDRGSQITFSALGQAAPVEAKRHWDPDGAKRSLLRERVSAVLPDLDVRAGGSTSIDITHSGIDKAYGIRRLSEATGIACERMLFIGDRLQPGGNDYPVIATGAETRSVDGWHETATVISRDVLPRLSADDATDSSADDSTTPPVDDSPSALS